MLRTAQFACTLPKADADALNAESGRVYTDMLVRHDRLYRKHGIWLVQKSGERLEDALGGSTTLHAHSRDAAELRFYKACKTARACRNVGLDVKYPHRRKRWRTTIWKAPKGIRVQASLLLLGRARGLAPVQVPLPSNLLPCPKRRSWKPGGSLAAPPDTTPGIWWPKMARSQPLHRRQTTPQRWTWGRFIRLRSPMGRKR